MGHQEEECNAKVDEKTENDETSLSFTPENFQRLLETNRNLVQENLRLKLLVEELREELNSKQNNNNNNNNNNETSSLENESKGEIRSTSTPDIPMIIISPNNVPEIVRRQSFGEELNGATKQRHSSLSSTTSNFPIVVPEIVDETNLYNLKVHQKAKRTRLQRSSNSTSGSIGGFYSAYTKENDSNNPLNNLNIINSNNNSFIKEESPTDVFNNNNNFILSNTVSNAIAEPNIPRTSKRDILKQMFRKSDSKVKSYASEDSVKEAIGLLKYIPVPDCNASEEMSAGEYVDFIKTTFERAPNDELPRGLQGSLHRETGFIYTIGDFYLNEEEETNKRVFKIQKSDKAKRFEEIEDLVRIEDDVGESNLVVCGTNSTLIVSDTGILIKSNLRIGGTVCVGSQGVPKTAKYFTLHTKYILGRRLMKVACGPYHFAAISDANEVILWGENRIVKNNTNEITGQLGHSNQLFSYPRFAVGISGTVIDIACGMYHTVAASSFAVYSCGNNDYGQLGRDGTEEEFQIVPGLFDDNGVPYAIVSVACGVYHTVAQTKCGTLFIWGKNQGLVAGRNDNYINEIPREVSQFRGNVKKVACGYYHTLVLTNDGVYSCGSTTFGQHGRGGVKKEYVNFDLVDIPHSKSIQSIYCGSYTSFALTKYGEVYTWGFLSDGLKTNHQYTPRLMVEISEKNLYVKSLSAGATHCCLLVDKRVSGAYQMFLKACLFSERVAISSIMKALPLDLTSLKFIQERAINKLQKSNPNLPAISVDKAYLYHCFVTSTVNTTVQYLDVKNTSPFTLTINPYVPEGQLDSMEGVAIGVHPNALQLSAGETATIRVNIKHDQEHESQFFICFLSSSSSGSSITKAKGLKYYVLVHLVPFFGSLDSYRKNSENKQTSLFLSQLASHVPQEILARLCSTGLPTQPTVRILRAAVLILDISGFTTLTHHLSQAGKSGGETITEYLNSYFSMLITVVNKHGGDIAKFVGDALICIFTNEPHWIDQPDTMDLLLLRAVQCAMEVQTDCAEYSREGLKLTLHIAVGAGELSSMIVGGTNKIWHYFVSGSAISNLNSALESSATGEVVVSGNSWSLIESYCEGEKRGNDWKINKVNKEPPLRNLKQLQIPSEAELAFRSIIPHFVQNAYERGARVDELRKATVMFIKLSNISYTDNSEENCQTINKLVLLMQQEIFRQEGMIIQFFEDEKGTLLLASFGLPPLSHEDDAFRAVTSAIAVHSELNMINVKSAIGVTTGDLFCGLVGSKTRKEYTIISSSVNLASRLMGVIAKLGGGVLCDQATKDACYPRLQFETLEPVVVKGTVDPVPIFKPLAQVSESIKFRRNSIQINSGTLVGRKKIQHKIKTHLHELVRGNNTWVTVLTGPEGMGKTTLVYFAMQLASTLGVYTLIGLSDPLQRATPFYVWKYIIFQLLGISPQAVDINNQVKDLALKLDCEEHFIPLFNGILPLDLPSNPVCDKLSNSAKNSFILGTLKKLIEVTSRSKPLLIVIENLHWVDSLSLSLASFVAKLDTPILLLVTVRPIQEAEVYKYSNFFNSPNIRHISIPSLTQKQCEKLAVNLFKAQPSSRIPPQILSIISKCQGNPYFCIELLLGFRDSKMIAVNSSGNWIVSPKLNITEIPSSVESAINSRLDCLAAATQDVLKIASVIGREFDLSILQYLSNESELESKLLLLVKLGFLRAHKSKYSFISDSVYKIAYSRLLFAQRKDLHEKLTVYYEKNLNSSPQNIPILAYHWDQVVSASTTPSYSAISNAIKYMRLAAECASRQEDKTESEYWLSRSLECLQKKSENKEGDDEKENKKLKLQVMGMALKDISKNSGSSTVSSNNNNNNNNNSSS